MEFEIKDGCMYYNCDCCLDKSWEVIILEFGSGTHRLEMYKGHPKPFKYKLLEIWHCNGEKDCIFCIGFNMGLPLCEVLYANNYFQERECTHWALQKIVNNWERSMNYTGEYGMIIDSFGLKPAKKQ